MTLEERIKNWWQEGTTQDILLDMVHRINALSTPCQETNDPDAPQPAPVVEDFIHKFDLMRDHLTDGQLANVLARYGYVPKAERADAKPNIIDALATLRPGFVGWSPELEPWFSALEEMAACLSQEQLAYMIFTRTGFVPKADLDAANERVAEVRRYNLGLANESQEYQERLRVARGRIKELCEEQRKTASFWERIRIKAATESNARIHELEAQLAERDADAEVGRATPRLCDGPRFGNFFGKAETMEIAQYAADAEVGKAIRELRPKEGHLWAEVDVVSFHVPTTTAYAIQWCDSMAHWKSPDTTALHDDLADAIREYNERED